MNPQKEPGNYDFFHHSHVQIRFNDIDIMKHVNNAVFQDYFDFARVGYFNEVFDEPLTWNGTTLILAAICIDFLHPVHIDHQIVVSTKTVLIGNKSLQMVQELYKLPEKKKMVFSRSVMVAFDPSAGCSVPVPDRWRHNIINFEKEVGFKQG